VRVLFRVKTRSYERNILGAHPGSKRRNEVFEMTTLHSPRRTRSQTTTGTPSAETVASTPEAEILRIILQEIGRLREEQKTDRESTQAELRRLESQISRSNNISARRDGACMIGDSSASRDGFCVPSTSSASVGIKLKPDTFDGTVPLREFLTQFNLIARTNAWSDEVKAVALASSLRGKARAVLDGISEIESLKFEELRSKLELYFGEGHLAQTYYTQFTNRKQKSFEDLAAVNSDIERLAYPECTKKVRDKIACAQFIAALTDGFIKRTLQLEGVNSLRTALERAMAIKAIQGNSFVKGNNFQREKGKNKFINKNREDREGTGGKNNKFQKKECWQCGEQGHFRSECPTLINEGNAD